MVYQYRLLLFLTALLSAVPSTAAEPSQRLAALDAAFARSGDFERCLSLAHIDQIDVVDRQHLVFRLGLNRFYLNTLPRRCHALSRNSGIVIDTRSTRLCDIDWVRVLRPFAARAGRLRGPACGLGQFERLDARPATSAPLDGEAGAARTHAAGAQ